MITAVLALKKQLWILDAIRLPALQMDMMDFVLVKQTLRSLALTKKQILHVTMKVNAPVGFLSQRMMDRVMKLNVVQKERMDFVLVNLTLFLMDILIPKKDVMKDKTAHAGFHVSKKRKCKEFAGKNVTLRRNAERHFVTKCVVKHATLKDFDTWDAQY